MPSTPIYTNSIWEEVSGSVHFLVKSAYKVADEETHGPLERIDVWNDPDILVSPCNYELVQNLL
jgi:hypothetical protein